MTGFGVLDQGLDPRFGYVTIDHEKQTTEFLEGSFKKSKVTTSVPTVTCGKEGGNEDPE